MSETVANAARLQEYYSSVIGRPAFGGANVLQHLADLALKCADGANAAQDAVAFALGMVFADHAENRSERIVTGDDNYVLTVSGAEYFTRAVKFVVDAGTAEDAVAIIAQLSQLTSDKLYGRG